MRDDEDDAVGALEDLGVEKNHGDRGSDTDYLVIYRPRHVPGTYAPPRNGQGGPGLVTVSPNEPLGDEELVAAPIFLAYGVRSTGSRVIYYLLSSRVPPYMAALQFGRRPEPSWPIPSMKARR